MNNTKESVKNVGSNFYEGQKRAFLYGTATIGENIRRYRNKLGLTQDDLVRKSDVKYTTLTKIEGDFVNRVERANYSEDRGFLVFQWKIL